MIERTTPEAVPELKQPSGTEYTLDFNPDHLMESAASRLDIGTDEEASETCSLETRRSDSDYLAQPVKGLDATREGFQTLENGNSIYDHPFEVADKLNCNQGNAVPGFMGTCGLVSVENVCRLAGKENVTEADIINVAMAHGDCDYHFRKPPENNGGTTFKQIQDILSHVGIESTVLGLPSIENVARNVEAGHGVIACVDVSEFWDDSHYEGLHAVTVTSVERDSTGNVAGFYVCDSGTGGIDGCRRVGSDMLDSALFTTIVTSKPIR